MCSLEKLLIKGIRSFSPENEDVITFYKPLTLIVGSNGAGKTTIIECLKQATTGELPPNTRSGQSFIHDPRVSGAFEVKAQIKLRFQAQSGQLAVAIRSFQLTAKRAKVAGGKAVSGAGGAGGARGRGAAVSDGGAGGASGSSSSSSIPTTLQFKALDQTVSTIDPATRVKKSMSYRCADMDRIVPQLMGVSKAMLDSVVFAHQDESLWPLGDAQGLKKRFDDLFAATKYAKALDALRKLRVEKNAQAKLGRARAGQLKEIARAAARERAALAQAEDKLEQLARSATMTSRKLEMAQRELRDAHEEVAKLERAETAAAQAQDEAVRAAGDAEAKKAALRSRYDLDSDVVDVGEARRGAREAEEAASDAHRASAAASREASTARQRAAAQREQLAADERRLARLDAEAQAARRAAAARDAAAREAEAELSAKGAELLRTLQQQQQQQTQQQRSLADPLAAVLASLPAEAVTALTRPLRPPLPRPPQRSSTPVATADESSSLPSLVIPEADIERLLATLRARADAANLVVEAARDAAASAGTAAAAEADAAAAALAAAREGAKSKRDVASAADARAGELREQASKLITGATRAAINSAEQHVAALKAAAAAAERALHESSAAAQAEDAARRGKEASERAAVLRAERARATKDADKAARVRLMEAAAGEAVEKLFAALHSRAARARLALLFGGGGGGGGGGGTDAAAAPSSSDFSSWPPPGKMRPRADEAVARARAAEERAAKLARSAAEEAAAKEAHLAAARSAAASTSADAKGALRQLAAALSEARTAMGAALASDIGLEAAVEEMREAAADAEGVVPSSPAFGVSGGSIAGGGGGGGGPASPSALSLATRGPALLPPLPPPLPDVPAALAEACRVLDEDGEKLAKLSVLATQARAAAARARAGHGCPTCEQPFASEQAVCEFVQKQEATVLRAEGAKNAMEAGYGGLKKGIELLRRAVLLRERCLAAGGGAGPSSAAAAAAAAAAADAAERSQRELEQATGRRAALEDAAHEGAWKIDAAAEEWLSARFAAEAEVTAGAGGNTGGGASSTAVTFSINACAEEELLPVSFFLGARNFDEFSSALEDKERKEREEKRAATQHQHATLHTQQQQQAGGGGGANPLRRLQDVEADLDAAERERDAAADAARGASRALEQLRADLAAAQTDLARSRDGLAQRKAQAQERAALEAAAVDAEEQAEALRAEAAAVAPAERAAEQALSAAAAMREAARNASRAAEEGAAALASAARALCDLVSLLAKAASEAGVAAISTVATTTATTVSSTVGGASASTNLERDRVVAALASGREALAKAEEDTRAAEARSAAVEKSMAHRDLKKRELEDVLSVKEAEARAAWLQADAERAELVAAEIAGPDRGESLKRAVRVAENHIREWQSSLDRGHGAEQAAAKQREEALRAVDSAGEQWRNPEAKHRAAFDDACALSLAAADVDRYHRALEKAILRFHAVKMEEINRAIKELWQRTYKGGDIDCIALRADAGDGVDIGGSAAGFFDGSGGASSSTAASASAAAVAATGASIGGKAARSYNYRLVMTTGGAELEMRGRCSAGQKMLASIIVRLALAEVLAVSCGVLALDEPTTNLDEANAHALADSLHAIVKDAQDRKTNLQLIVITHDEAFARRLGDMCPFMWRVEKNDEQSSTIRRVAAREGFGNE